MRVLHIYQKDDAQVELYVTMLRQALAESVESMATTDPAEASHLCEVFHPNIVHRHGNVAFKCTTAAPIRQVATPHGRLSSRFLPVFVYLVRSEMEANRAAAVKELRNGHPRPHVETVLNSIVTKLTNVDEMGKNVLRIYRKVLDSQPLQLMNEATRTMLAALLKAGICGDKRWVAEPPRLEDWLPKVEEVDFRQIFIYAQYENVSDIVGKGLDALQIEAPDGETDYDIYLPESYAKPQPMQGNDIEAMLYDVKKNGLTLLRMTDLATVFLRENMDEDRFIADLKEKELNVLMACILQLMNETFLWDVGYMPCDPVDNRETQLLRAQIENHLNL